MKHNKAALYALCALAALGAAAAILLSGADIARVLLCYPLEFTGKALRSLSLAGGALNVLAIALYAAIKPLSPPCWRLYSPGNAAMPRRTAYCTY